MHEDGEWLADVRCGNHATFERLYDKYSKPLFRAIVAITRDQPAAEEILQESFVRLYQNAAKLDPARPVLPWLYRVAINLSYNWVSRDHRRFTSLEDLMERCRVFFQHPLDVEKEVEKHVRADAVHKAIEKLDGLHRAVIVLFYLEDFSLAEIAEILKVPLGTAKSRLHYARKELERVLKSSETAQFNGKVSYELL
jgi:RNA polymerase sigma-70 factor (ECF subfamily)